MNTPQSSPADFPNFPIKKKRFLEHFAESGCIGSSSAFAGISRRTHLNWRKTDTRFAAAYEEARDVAIESLEQEALRRSKDGVEVPVFHQGKEIGTIRKYSDLLLIFLLKAMKPEKYRDGYERFPSAPNASDAEEVRKSLQAKLARLAAQQDQSTAAPLR